ncbi:hypothetical protein CR513_46543, partial [Mucuna pruriens]
MENAKVMSTPLATHFKLSSRHSPSNEVEKTNMSLVLYAYVVDSLMYVMMCTRPDIAHAVGTKALECCEKILRYFHGTSGLRLCFGGDKPTLVGYSNSYMVGDIDSRKSTLDYLIKFARGAMAWQFKLQKCVALFTTEVEFIHYRSMQEVALGEEILAGAWFCSRQILSAIHFGKNSTFHSRSKHIDVRYHWIGDILDAKLLKLAKIHTDDNGADMMTKVLPRGNFEACFEIPGLTITST